MIMHILEIVYIITVFITVLFIVRVDKNINTFPVESEILFNGIMFSNNGLWEYDSSINRLYPGILDFDNFNDKSSIQKSLNEKMYYGPQNTRAAAELILEENNGTTYAPVYYNEVKYKEWVEWYKANVVKGAGARQGKTKQFTGLIKKQEGLALGNLNITILIPN